MVRNRRLKVAKTWAPVAFPPVLRALVIGMTMLALGVRVEVKEALALLEVRERSSTSSRGGLKLSIVSGG